MTLVWDVPFPTQSQMLIALKLADYANDDGTSIYPAKDTLAEKARCDESTVKRTLKLFRDCGLLHLVRQGGNGPKDTNEWQLNVGLLKAVSEGRATIEGNSKELVIGGELPAELDLEGKGGMVNPLLSTRGDSEPLRGDSAPHKGGASDPQPTNNHHLEPSARERAKNSISDLKNGKPQPVRSAIRVTPADPSWQHWLDHLRKIGHAEIAERAERAGEMTACSRWPRAGPDEPLPHVPKPANIFTDRMLGEAVK